MQDTPKNPLAGWLVFTPAVFISAFLVFQIQPLISKYILPWYGGTAAVWTTCLLVFQILLFAGYAYAHLLSKLDRRAQAAIHVGLLLVASVVSIVPADTWKPRGDENPLVRIVAMLALTVGLPYFALSATGPLLQAWFWRVLPSRSPYPLYALSNAGSLLALLSYPFLVEPNLSGTQQAIVWRAGFFVFLVLSVFGARLLWSTGRDVPSSQTERGAPELDALAAPRSRMAFWIAWSACSVVLFMAITNQLTLNVASIPFLWILPLSIYLLTFIVAFSGSRWYPRLWMGLLLFVSVAVVFLLVEMEVRLLSSPRLPMAWQIFLYASALFVLCLVCHGELYRLKPPPARLTSFYLAIALGGALGGIIVGVVAPIGFLWYQELHLGMLGCCVLWLVSGLRDPESRLFRGRFQWVGVAAVIAVIGFTGLLALQTRTLTRGALETRRSFFGFLRVREVGRGNPGSHALRLFDGSTLHGHQFVDPRYRNVPTVYYSTMTGVGGVMIESEREGGRRVGVVGLGSGTLATYGRPGDYLRFYEINPDVVDLATTSFSFLRGCSSKWEIALGDARLKLEQEPSQQFDVLVLDAFSSDAIPVHLLTTEAFELYDKHLSRDGVIAINISNLHLNLAPVVYRLGVARGFRTLQIHNRDRSERVTLAATWMVLSRDERFLEQLARAFEPLREAGDVLLAIHGERAYPDVRLWTDNRSSLFQILR